MRRAALAALALLLLRADMFPDASNAKLPEAQQNLGITSISAGLYGAQGNRVDVAADLTIAAGSTSATTTATAFTSADVGKLLIVYGAGTSGRALSTTIAAVGGPHAIMLGNAAVTAVSGAGFEYASDPHDGLQSAINAAEAQGGGRVVIPPGKYIIKAQNRVNLKSNVTLDGENAVEIRCDDTVNAPAPQDNSCLYGSARSRVTLQDFRLKGMLDIVPIENGISAPLMVTTTDTVTVTGLEISYTRSASAAFWSSKKLLFSLNRMHHGTGGVDVSNVDSSVISLNEISDCNDNPIAVGVGDMTSGLTSPLSNTNVVGNIITDCWATSLAGSKSTTFSNNLVKRAAHQALFIAPYTGFNNGDTAMVGVTVANNVFLDLIKTTPPGQAPQITAAYIVLNGGQRQPGSLASVPGYPASGTGAVADLYGTGIGRYWTMNTKDPTIASPGGGSWAITNNVMMRTLPAVAAATDWGYGGLWNGVRSTAGVPYTGPVTEADLNVNCITITGPLRNARISGNTCNTTGDYGILFDELAGYTPANGDHDGLTITDNKFIDYKIAGININPTAPASYYSQVVVARNEFNADPRFVAANRGAGGTWTNANPPHGIDNPKMSGMQIEGNHFRNVSVPITVGAGNAIVTSKNNTIYGTFAAAGFSTSNVGIGTPSQILGISDVYKVVNEDSVPASATFGKQLTAGGEYSATVPTTGSWLAGTMVWKQVPILDANGRVWLGWMRITTGAGNVDGVDWRAVYGSPTTAGGGFTLASTTVGALPTCNAAAKYTTYAVSDASAPAWNATVAGAGAVAVPVMCDGAAWKVR